MTRHIRQKNSSEEESRAYTVVIADEELEVHGSIVEHPNLFEIVDIEIPEDAQYLIYSG